MAWSLPGAFEFVKTMRAQGLKMGRRLSGAWPGGGCRYTAGQMAQAIDEHLDRMRRAGPTPPISDHLELIRRVKADLPTVMKAATCRGLEERYRRRVSLRRSMVNLEFLTLAQVSHIARLRHYRV
jgi:hypothetical protein